MTTTTLTKSIPLEHKIDMIFNFLFAQKNALEESYFWNRLQKNEIKEINALRKEKTKDFSELKKKYL